jgi:hypothetical protein
MNKTTKVALCISLVGIGVFAWPHFAAAGKPAAPVWLTFGPGGDVVSAAPQEVLRQHPGLYLSRTLHCYH